MYTSPFLFMLASIFVPMTTIVGALLGHIFGSLLGGSIGLIKGILKVPFSIYFGFFGGNLQTPLESGLMKLMAKCHGLS